MRSLEQSTAPVLHIGRRSQLAVRRLLRWAGNPPPRRTP
jgi:hypothetical protein